MIPIIWVYWLVSLTIVTYASVFVVKKFKNYGFAALVAFYVIYLGASQILAARFISFDLGVYSYFAPASVFIYPFIAQAIDMINEVYGKKMAHLAIGIALVTQVLLVIFIAMTNSLAPAPFFQYEEAWQSIFTLGIRITVASWVAFLICQNLDAIVFDKIKQRFLKREINFGSKGWRGWLNPFIWLRSTVSDALDLTLDSFIFVTLAFYGMPEVSLMALIIGQIVSKNIIGFLDTPWFVWYKKMLGNEKQT